MLSCFHKIDFLQAMPSNATSRSAPFSFSIAAVDAQVCPPSVAGLLTAICGIYAQPVHTIAHNLIHALSTLEEHRLMVAQNGLRGVVARCTGDTAAGVRAGAAMIEAL